MSLRRRSTRGLSLARRNPLAAKQWRRFRSIRRGYWSALLLTLALVLSLGAELLVNSRALVVSYQGDLHFPTYGAFLPGTTFGLSYEFETNYRELERHFEERGEGDWVLMPPVPFNALENDLATDRYPPYAPSLASGHYLGTDSTGRDVLARNRRSIAVDLKKPAGVDVVLQLVETADALFEGFRPGVAETWA